MSTFLTIRVILCVIVALALPLIILKTNIRKNKWYIILTLVLAVAFCAMHFVYPLENVIYRFETPQEAMDYYNGSEVIASLDQAQSCLVVLKDGDCVKHEFIPYSSVGYQLPTVFFTSKATSGTVEGGSYEIVYISSFYEFYLMVNTTLTGEVTGPEGLVTVTVGDTTYIYVPLASLTDPCTLTVGGTELVIQ